jgi:hypothetical protein
MTLPSAGAAASAPDTSPPRRTSATPSVSVAAQRVLGLVARDRRSRSIGVLVGSVLALVFVLLGRPATGDAGAGERVEMRALGTPVSASAPASAPEPASVAADPADAASDAVDAALERRAADAIAEGRYADASRLHARLAQLHPERPVHRAAARILGESAGELAAPEPGDVVWAGRGRDVR